MASKTEPSPDNGAEIVAGQATVNRKKQKRRQKQAARLAAAQTTSSPGADQDSQDIHADINGTLPSHSTGSVLGSPLEDGPMHETTTFYDPDGLHLPVDIRQPSDPRLTADPDVAGPSNRSKKKKKNKLRTDAPPLPPQDLTQYAMPPHNAHYHAPLPPAPPPLLAANSSAPLHAPAKDRIWNTSTTEERERIKDFWLSLDEPERRSLVKVEKEAVLKKMKEQQKHSCSCTVCGRKRTAIEEELEVLYDAYYQELEMFANHQHLGLPNGSTIMPPPPANAYNRLPLSAPATRLPPASTRMAGSYIDDDEPDDEAYSDEESEGDYYPPEAMRHPASDFFNFGNSLTVQGGILTVADDLLQNDGKRFIEMMEQLAERRMQREEEAHLTSAGLRHPALPAHDHGPPLDDEDYEEEEEDDYVSDEEDDYAEEEMEAMTEEQRMEEGRRMFQIFAARMFEQRVLTAYREKVAQERQEKLLQELAEEDEADAQREAKKAKEAQKRKDKKRQQKAAKEEERVKKEAEKAAEEAAIKQEEERRLEEQRLKKEQQRLKRDAERLAQEEERRRKEAERQRKQQELREQQADAERKQREAREKEKKRKEDARRKERDERDAKERERERAEREAPPPEKKTKPEARSRAEREKAKREENAAKREAAQSLGNASAVSTAPNDTSGSSTKAALASSTATASTSKSTTAPATIPSSTSKVPAFGSADPPPPSASVSRKGALPAVPAPPGLGLPSQPPPGFSSPHTTVATPVIPKASTPMRARQASHQSSHHSSPRSVPAPPNFNASTSSSPPPASAPLQASALPTKPLQPAASQATGGQTQGPFPGALPTSSLSSKISQPASTPRLPNQGSQPVSSQTASGPSGPSKVPQPLTLSSGAAPALASPRSSVPGLPSAPLASLHQHAHDSNASALGSARSGLSNAARAAVGGDTSAYRQQPFSAPPYRSFPSQPPSAFPPNVNGTRSTQLPSAGSASTMPGPIGSAVAQPHGHGRQLSGSHDASGAFHQPIARPAPIQPPSTRPSLGESGNVDDISRRLGSSALLDDAEDDMLANSEPDGMPSGLRTNRPPIGPPTDGLPLKREPQPMWEGLPTCFVAPGVPVAGSWSERRGSGRPMFRPQIGPGGGYVRPHSRPVQLRLMVCEAASCLNQAGAAGNQFHWLEQLQRQVEALRPDHGALSAAELLEICDTEGDASNGGGSFVFQDQRDRGQGLWVKHIPDEAPSTANAMLPDFSPPQKGASGPGNRVPSSGMAGTGMAGSGMATSNASANHMGPAGNHLTSTMMGGAAGMMGNSASNMMSSKAPGPPGMSAPGTPGSLSTPMSAPGLSIGSGRGGFFGGRGMPAPSGL